MKHIARHIFQHALGEASVIRAFERHVSCDRDVLRICEDLYSLGSYRRVIVVAIGKAAHAMLKALYEQTGDRFEGIVASPIAPEFHIRGFRYYQGGHPLPNADSLRAGDALLKTLHGLDESCLVIYLISGGGSAAVEKPIDNEISLEDIVATYQALVHSGASIAEINAIRKHLSMTKGGRLAQAAYPAQQVSIMISDVPDKTPDALASGPTLPDSTSISDCHIIAEKYEMLRRFPASIRELFERHALEETPKSDDPAFIRSRWWTVLSNSDLLQAAKREAEQQGFSTFIDNRCDDWDYAKAADYLLGRLHELMRSNERVCLLSGGEVTVRVTNGGTGGRNQQFALYCVETIRDLNVCVLSAGSDGVDGNSPAAGAICDGTSAERAKARGLDLEKHLDSFNSFPVFQELDDLVQTGPTGNNLRDIRILLAG